LELMERALLVAVKETAQEIEEKKNLFKFSFLFKFFNSLLQFL
jgi:hypothetical protein